MKKLTTILLLILNFLVIRPANAGVDLDGNDYIDTNYTPGSVVDFSWGAKFSLDDTPTGEVNIMGVFGSAGGVYPFFQLTFDTSLTPICMCGDDVVGEGYDTLTASEAITVGVPANVTCTFDQNGNMSIYINGVQKGTQANSSKCTGAKNIDREYYVGCRHHGLFGEPDADTCMDGKLYEYAFWSSTLTDTDVQNWAKGPKRKACEISPSTLIKYMPLDEGATGASSANATVNNMCGSDVDAGAVSNTTNTWIADSSSVYPPQMISKEEAEQLYKASHCRLKSQAEKDICWLCCEDIEGCLIPGCVMPDPDVFYNWESAWESSLMVTYEKRIMQMS